MIAPDDLYHGITKLLKQVFIPWGLQVSFVDTSSTELVQEAWQENTKLVWLETPSNPLLKISDVAALADFAHSQGARVACDATWTPPTVQRSLDLGADLVLHSTTKYLAGHSDVLGGAVIAKRAVDLEQIRTVQNLEGAVPSPFDCWLVLRSLRTLPYRMRAHTENAGKVAAFLAAQPQVERVYYPGLESHPNFEVAARQMDSFGGMLSFEVEGGGSGGHAGCRERATFYPWDEFGRRRKFARAPCQHRRAGKPDAPRTFTGVGGARAPG